jgi:hypothetical protein
MGKAELDVGMLDSHNYFEWRVRMEDLLIYKDLGDYLTIKEDQIQSPEQTRGDRKALSLLRSRVTQQYLPYVQASTHAKQA